MKSPKMTLSTTFHDHIMACLKAQATRFKMSHVVPFFLAGTVFFSKLALGQSPRISAQEGVDRESESSLHIFMTCYVLGQFTENVA